MKTRNTGDYSHTIIVMIIILYFMFNVYTTNDLIGSPGEMYRLLKQAAADRPVAGNADGEYLTLKSNFGLVFGVIQLCSGMGTVFLDQGYWQRAIASRPTTAVKAYILGGLSWFAIPFGFATTLGLAAVALTSNPKYPTYPDDMTELQVSSGLVAPFAAQTLLGKNGAVALLLTLFMAVTSSSSAQLIAVSSILTFDVYKTYVRPASTPDQLIVVAHVMICAFAVVMAAFASIWNIIGISLGWLFVVMGLIIGGAVFPAAFTVTWRGQTRLAAIAAPLCGLAAGLTAWLIVAKVYYGELSVATTGAPYPTLAGNMASVLTGCIVSVVVSVVLPGDGFDWSVTRNINPEVVHGTDPDGPGKPASVDEEKSGGTKSGPAMAADNAQVVNKATCDEDIDKLQTIRNPEAIEDEKFLEDPKALHRHYIIALTLSLVLSFIMDVLFPIPMFLTHYILSHNFFYAWVVVSFIWVFGSMAVCGLLPLWETRRFLKEFFTKVFTRN